MTPALSIDEARKIVAPLYEALNQPGEKDVPGLLAKAAHPDYRSYHTNEDWLTRDQLAEVFRGMGVAVPDLGWRIIDIQTFGDRIVVRGEATGTPTGEFWAPSRRASRSRRWLSIFSGEDGKLASAYHVENWTTALEQLHTYGSFPNDSNLPDIGRVSTEVVDGLRIRIVRSGRTGEIPILFTSPWPESLYSYWRILPHFAHAHPVVAVDLPGFGLSESRPDVMSPKAIGAFLVKLAQHLKLERLHGVGPDVGTPAFLFAAAGHPELFESLVLGGGATRVDLAAGRLETSSHRLRAPSPRSTAPRRSRTISIRQRTRPP